VGRDVAGQAEIGIVGDLDGFIDVVVADDHEHRPEDLLAGNDHVVGDIGETRGLHVPALVQTLRSAKPPATSVAPSSMPFWMYCWMELNCALETTGAHRNFTGWIADRHAGAAFLATRMASSIRAFGTSMREVALQV
jgi:hypothetical protein